MANPNIEEVFLRCSAQTICGIKPANLFPVPVEQFNKSILKRWKRIASSQGLSICVYKNSSRIVMIFIYDFLWIRKILGDFFVQFYLAGKDYFSPWDTTRTLRQLIDRLKGNVSFPHEVGIFLGYPIEDVISFEENHGKFCKYCGYWKSYCNPEDARECCDRYRQCSQMCMQWFDEGYSIPQIIKKYKKFTVEAA